MITSSSTPASINDLPAVGPDTSSPNQRQPGRTHSRVAAWALTSRGWQSNVLLEWDDTGTLTRVAPLDLPSPVASAGIVIPGLPNLHSHVFQYALAGLTGARLSPTDSFWSWREAMYCLADRLTPGQFEAIAAFAQARMLERGFTSCGEFHYLHHQPGGKPYDYPAEMGRRLLVAAERSGISLTLLPVFYTRAGFDSAPLSSRQRRFGCSPDQYARLQSDCQELLRTTPRHRLGIAPHSLRAVAPEQLRELLDVQGSTGQPVHIHVAEQVREVADCQQALGARPVEWLLANCAADRTWCLVHATHTTAAEREAMAGRQLVAGICPTTEADLGDGVFDTEHWWRLGGRLGVGSDSNTRIDPAEELRWLEYQCRLGKQLRLRLAEDSVAENGRTNGRCLFDWAVSGGAQALAQVTGSLEVGYRADWLELDAEHPLLCSLKGDQWLDAWIFAHEPDMLKSVFAAGCQVVADSRHLRIDTLRENYLAAMWQLQYARPEV